MEYLFYYSHTHRTTCSLSFLRCTHFEREHSYLLTQQKETHQQQNMDYLEIMRYPGRGTQAAGKGLILGPELDRQSVG